MNSPDLNTATAERQTGRSINLEKNNSLLLKLQPPFFSRTYGCIQIFTTAAEEITLRYELEIRYLKTIPDGPRIYRLNRLTEVLVNDTEPDLLMDILASRCGQVFYPLEVKIDFSGKFIGVHNAEEIRKRWPELKTELKDYFVSEVSDRYLELMEQAINSSELLDERFRQDLFLNTYFFPVYKSYTEELRLQEDLYFPLEGTAPIRFDTIQLLQPYLNHYDAIVLHHSGTANDERTVGDIEAGYDAPLEKAFHPEKESIRGSYTADYVFGAHTKSIESVVARWNLEMEPERSIEIRMFRIDEEDLKDNQAGGSSTAGSLVFLDPDSRPKEKEKPKSGLGNIFNAVFRKKNS